MLHPIYIKSNLPEGQSGKWTVKRFTVPDLTPQQRQADQRPDWAKSSPGVYTCLQRGQQVFMTDLYDEWWTQKVAFDQALRRGGAILTTGLGLGMIVESLLRTPGCPVDTITVIEQSADVIRLVAPYLKGWYGDRLHIINANAFTWTPPSGSHYSVIWHDIWPNPADPVAESEMRQLYAHFQPYCDWQGSWAQEFERMNELAQGQLVMG